MLGNTSSPLVQSSLHNLHHNLTNSSRKPSAALEQRHRHDAFDHVVSLVPAPVVVAGRYSRVDSGRDSEDRGDKHASYVDNDISDTVLMRDDDNEEEEEESEEVEKEEEEESEEEEDDRPYITDHARSSRLSSSDPLHRSYELENLRDKRQILEAYLGRGVEEGVRGSKVSHQHKSRSYTSSPPECLFFQ